MHENQPRIGPGNNVSTDIIYTIIYIIFVYSILILILNYYIVLYYI